MAMVKLGQSTSPHALRLIMASSDTGTLSQDQATIIGLCAEGPLKKFLQGLTSSQWNSLNTDMRMRVTISPRGTAAAARAAFTGGNLVIQAEGASDFTCDLELVHTIMR